MSRHRQFKLPRAPENQNGAIQSQLHESPLPKTSTTSRTREEENQSFVKLGEPVQSVVEQDTNLPGQYIDPQTHQPIACSTIIPPDLLYPIQQDQMGVDQQAPLSNYMSDRTVSTESEQYTNPTSVWEHDNSKHIVKGTQENLKLVIRRNDGGELLTTDKLHDVHYELDKIPKQRQFKLPPAPNYQNKSSLLSNHQMISDNGKVTSEADIGCQSHFPQNQYKNVAHQQSADFHHSSQRKQNISSDFICRNENSELTLMANSEFPDLTSYGTSSGNPQNAVEHNNVSKHRQFKLPPAGNYSNKTQSNGPSGIESVLPGNNNGQSFSDAPVSSQQCHYPSVDDYLEVQETFASSNWNPPETAHFDSLCEDNVSRPILPESVTEFNASPYYQQYKNLLICSHQDNFIEEDVNQNVQADFVEIQKRVTEDGQTFSESTHAIESVSDFIWENDGSGTTLTTVPENLELQNPTDDGKNEGSLFIDERQDVSEFNKVPEKVRQFSLPSSGNFLNSEITEHIHSSSVFTNSENVGSRSISREDETESNKNKEHRQFSLPRAPNYVNSVDKYRTVLTAKQHAFPESSYVFTDHQSTFSGTDVDPTQPILHENQYQMIVDEELGYHHHQQDETVQATECEFIWNNDVLETTDRGEVTDYSSEYKQFDPPPVENYVDYGIQEHQNITPHSSSALSITVSTFDNKDTNSEVSSEAQNIDPDELQSFANTEVQCQSSFIPFDNQNQLDGDMRIQSGQCIAQNCSGLDYQHHISSQENFHRDTLVLEQTSENSVVYPETHDQIQDSPGLIFKEHHHKTTEQMPGVSSNSLWESTSLESLNGENLTQSNETLELQILRAKNFEKNADDLPNTASTIDNLLSAVDNEQLSSDEPPSHCETGGSQDRLQKNQASPQESSDLLGDQDLENSDEISKLEKAMFSKLWARYSRRKRVLIPCSLTEKVPLPTVNAVPDSFELHDPLEDSFDVVLSRTCSSEDGLRTYHVTTEEVNRRINGVEKLNNSNLALTLRKQKSKSCGETIRKKLKEKGIYADLNSKQNVSPNKILVMSEAEGVHLVMDLDDIVRGSYPADDIANEIVQEAMMDESVNLDSFMDVEAFSECMRSLRDTVESVVPPITGILPKASNNKDLNLVMEEFSEATHGIGIVTQPTWIYALTEIGKGVTTLVREELERSNEDNEREGENCQTAE
ncbi:hypothetical protein GCK72_008105 [Caenorhabditis remanei]|uniref:Transcription factor AP-2 C-terminal domain-containing protein n=1 Tax=Caenorhabditis remanei TaxID=31234 RepID=A0A6A5HP86_CAERE|nr:hypothetical protein GCK72_008105 [Caenorhabditis remanei]KAF1768143.1 hypothetical protein GCK72_008105 [Caenorhabditis remanei]